MSEPIDPMATTPRAPSGPDPSDEAPSPGVTTDEAPEAAGTAVALDVVAERRRRRRKAALLAFLASLVGVFLLFTGWYLLFRKPVTELPIPPIVQTPVPHYVFSIYGVQRPIGVTVSPTGDRIYVAETGGDRVVRIYDGKGNAVGQIAPPKSEAGARIPVYLALDPTNGDVYVSDRITASISIFTKDGGFRRTFEPKPTIPEFKPLGVAVDKQGDLYVGDLGGQFQTIKVFASDGTLKRTIGTPGQFNFPNGLSVDDKGNLYVADSNNGRVLVLDPEDRMIGAIPRGVGAGELGLPKGTALDDSGRLFVADSTGQDIQIYGIDPATGKPRYQATVGIEGRGDGQFEYPFGVAADARARIYVADWANDRVQVWSY